MSNSQRVFILDTVLVLYICSYEHESPITSSLAAHIAQTNWQTSAARIEFMDSTLKTLMIALRAIRDQADSVLRQVEQPTQQRSLVWKCAACGHIKHFTRPALAEIAAPCPKSGGVTMESL